MKRFIVSTLVLVSVLAAVASAPWTARVHAVTNYYVGPSGSDSNSGTSASAPFATLQKALDVAGPGDVINLAAGTYLQDAVSRRDGSASAPITITGPATAVIKGAGGARVLQIHHDHHILDGFTIDGLHGDPNSMSGYRDKLLYVIGVEPLNGVTGLKVRTMTFKNGGGECLRMRYFAQNNEVANSTFQNCGVHDFWFNAGGKNGEAIYIGTAPEQWGMNGAPTADPDQSNHNWVHHNVINTQGNECVDIKEASSFNIVEHNDCTGQRDPNSAGLDSRGNANTFRFNKSYGNTGAGIRFGGDTASDGIDNDAYGNEIFDNAAGGIKFMRTPQGKVCGNTMYNNTGGNSVGTYASEFDPTAPCPDEPTPTPTSGTAPTATPTTPPAGSSKLAVAAVSASSHDGNVPENTLDGSLDTRWSAEGDGQWIKYDLGASKTVDLLKIAFHRGDLRLASFDIELSSDNVSWTRVFSGQSSGSTLQLQTFDFANSAARWVRIVGHGNTENAWNSLTEVEIWGSDEVAPTPTPVSSAKLAVAAVSASSHDGNVPENTLDGSLSTRWSAEGDGQWIKYDLGASKTVELLKIAFHRGDLRVASFDIELSSDNSNWTRVFSGQSSGSTLQLQTFDFGNSAARWVRIVGHGNSENAWNSLTEVEIWGSGG